MTTTSGDSAALLRYRRRRLCLTISFIIFLLLAALILTLALTLFRVRDPTTELLSAMVVGVSPHISFPVLHFSLNLTLSLQIRVRNPNVASFSHAPGKALVSYRGVTVGDAVVSPGRIPARGEEVVGCDLTVEADKVTSQLAGLISDVTAGEVGFDTSTRIPGRVSLLGVFKHHAVATSQCHVAVGFPDLRMTSQECSHKTKL